MLTLAQYTAFWTDPAPGGFGQITAPPSYHEYVQREIYQQDYLDLFLGTGAPTFPRNLTALPGCFLVSIPGTLLAGLGIIADPFYTVSIGGTEYLKVVYNFPWPLAELTKKREIKYIMVGEAPPPIASSTYFYNILDLASTFWLNAPVSAFAAAGLILPTPIATAPKSDKLLFLANNGYVLLDIFPFAYPITSALRAGFNANGVSVNFFKNQINRKLRSYQAYELLDKQPIIALSGPPTIHHYLADKISVGELEIKPNNIDCKAYQNHFCLFVPPYLDFPPLTIDWLPGAALLNSVYANPGIKVAPYYRCCCYDGGLINPNQLFIRNAFGLP